MGRPRSKIVKPKRSRGGQPGNTNRLIHGFYSRAERLSLAEARALIARSRLAAAGGLSLILGTPVHDEEEGRASLFSRFE